MTVTEWVDSVAQFFAEIVSALTGAPSEEYFPKIRAIIWLAIIGVGIYVAYRVYSGTRQYDRRVD